MKLHFYGGARSVTGANYLLEDKDIKILVDCGLVQGVRHAEEKNYEDFPYNPKDIDYLLLTHAHIDHTGRIPKLYKDGFRGKIITTKATKDLAYYILSDSQKILEKEAKRYRQEPLYSKKDVEDSLKLAEGVEYGEKINLGKGVACRFRDAGHILGSAIIEVWFKNGKSSKKIVFSGDLGNPPVPLLKPTEFIDKADYVVIESAYGDRLHETKEQRKDLLENAIEDTVNRNGVLMIPSFAMERTQEMLYELNALVENGRVPKAPVFIDSPLAINLLGVYKKYPNYYNKKAIYLIKSGDNLFKFPGLTFTKTVEESKRINEISPPKIIIAGSGMSTGGRILYHELRYLPDPNSAILFVGFQVAGTLGRRILDGEKSVKIFGEDVPVRAEIRSIPGYSAHADQKMLADWINKIKRPIKHVFVVQGEESAELALVQIIEDHLGVEASAPTLNESVDL